MIYVIISAFFYVWATVFPPLSCFFMTTFLMPICLYRFPDRLRMRFGYGFLWGSIVFSVHWSWVLILLITKGTSWAVCFSWIFLVGWCSGWSGLWFCLFPYARLCSTVLFFILITQYSFFITGVIEGYPLFNPLVVLAEYPIVLGNLYWLSDVGMIFLLCAVQIVLVDVIRYRHTRDVFVLIGCFGLFAMGCQMGHNRTPVYPQALVTICPWWYGCGDPMFAGYRMSHDLCVVMQKYPTAQVVVMPESTYCWDLQEYSLFLPIWSDSAGAASVLFGAHEIENSVSHNAAFLLHNNELVFRYRKQHFMPIIERSIWLEKLCHHFIGNKFDVRSPVHTDDDDVIKISDQIYQLFICSEFFFESKPVKGYPILLLWNDTWLCLNWVKRLALLFIDYFEKKHHVFVLHVSTEGRTNISWHD